MAFDFKDRMWSLWEKTVIKSSKLIESVGRQTTWYMHQIGGLFF